MAVYKLKVTFEDYDDIFRVIEIKSTQTFYDLHKAILASIGFDEKHMASFYMSSDSWLKGQEITLEDMSNGEDEEMKKIPVMKKSLMQNYIDDPHQKIIYIYDFMEMWTLHLELSGIEINEKAGIKYPVCSKSVGMAPKQYDKIQRLGIIEDNEFDELTKNYIAHADEIPESMNSDEADEFGPIDDEQGEAEGEETEPEE